LHRRKDGVLLDVEISASNIMLDGRYCIFASSRDVTERKRLERELLQTTIQLRDLVAKFESSQEAERKSIAREVHDELGQILSTLRLDISMIRSRFGKHNTELMVMAENMTGLVDRAIHGVRDVSENLRPAVLSMGIFAAIEWLCGNFSTHTGIPCVLGSPDPCVDLEEARAVVIFRIVQESLTNVMRHAHARNVNIVLSLRDENLCVEVKDDGRGFDMNNEKQLASYGLLGMRERARAWGGHLGIASTPDNGTVVSLNIPINDKVD
jgi:signal transduction histidine kinase